MSRPLPRWTCLSLAATLLVAAGAFAQDNKDQGKKKPGDSDRKSPTTVARDAQRAAGVIVKAESIAKGAKSRSDDVAGAKAQAATHRLTVNTAAVWRDWVRDQAGVAAGASPREQARRGANSVATKGEPQSEASLVVIDIGPNTKIETRFRASNDETRKGAKTPAEALEANKDPATEKGKGDPTKREAEAGRSQITRFQADDLQPGLFVEIDFEHKDGRNVASTATVIRPVGGSDSAPAEPTRGESKGESKGKK
jgi:hypothetical protein